jgi:hypothetical protein
MAILRTVDVHHGSGTQPNQTKVVTIQDNHLPSTGVHWVG